MSFRKTEFQNNGSPVSSDVSKINFGNRISATYDSNGRVNIDVISGDLLKKTGDKVTGNITFEGANIVMAGLELVDGRDVSKDGAVLDLINTGTGFIVRTGSASYARRTFQGTDSQISISNGDGIAENPVVSLPERVVMPGTDGVVIPRGTSAQRASDAISGLTRYNTDLEAYEVYSEDDWRHFVLDNDPRIFDPKIIHVSSNATADGFTSIKAAIDSITDNGFMSRYTIEVAPGGYWEDQIVMKEFVTIVGTSSDNTSILANDPTQHLIVACPNSGIHNMELIGQPMFSGYPTVTGAAAVYASFTTPSSQSAAFMLTNIRFSFSDTLVLTDQPTLNVGGTVFLENVMIGGGATFIHGFKSMGPGYARINIRSLTSNGIPAAPACLFMAEGTQATVVCTSAAIRSTVTGGTGMHLRNGGTARLIGVSMLGFAKGVWIENFGAASTLDAQAINLQNNTQDIVIEHPGAQGHFTGSAERTRSTVNVNAPITVFYSDPATKGIVTSGPIYAGAAHDTTVNITSLIGQGSPMGVLAGGQITKGSGLTISVAAGSGYIDSGGEAAPGPLVYLQWPTTTVAIAANSAVYVYVTAANVIATSATIPDPLAAIVLGRVISDAASIGMIEFIPTQGRHPTNYINRMMRLAFGPLYQTGSAVTENATTAFNLDVTAGIYWYGAVRIAPAGGAKITFRDYSHNAGAWTFATTQTVNNTHYDNGTNLTALTADYYAVHALYTVGDGANETYMLVRAQSQYATLVEAEAAMLPTPPGIFGNSMALIGTVIVKQGATKITSILDSRPTLAYKTPTLGAASEHGNLLGLNQDDHPQYVLANGNRSMAGDLDMGGFSITNVNLVDALNVVDHSDRHQPNGTDPLATGAPSTNLSPSTTNTEGFANAFARADHTHKIEGFQVQSTELTGVAALAATGLVTRTAAGTYTARSITGPAAGMTVTNGNGVAGNIALSFANDLAALEALAATGLAVRTGTDTWATRTVQGTANQITVTNGNAVSGDPTVALAANPVMPGTEGFVPPVGSTAQRPATGMAGETRYNTTLGRLEYWDGSRWATLVPSPRYFSGYCNSALSLTTTFQGLPIGVENRKDNIYTHATNGTTVTVSVAGWYEVYADISMTVQSGTNGVAELAVLQNGTVVPGSLAWTNGRSTTDGNSTASVQALVYLNAGDTLSMAAREMTSIAMATVANGSRLLIKEAP